MQIEDTRIDPRLVPEGSRAHVLNGPKREYQDLPSVVTPDGRVISRWVPSADERAAIMRGEDIFVTICTFGQLLQPVMVTVGPVDWNDAATLP